MLFSDTIFLLLFLPGVLCIYYLIKCVTNKSAIRNLFLLMASIFFYAWGNWNYLYLLLVSVLLNYVLGYLIYLLEKWKKFLLFVTVIINIGILFYFKYQYFVLYNISNLLNQDWNLVQIELPIGISFFTFQAMSYVIDVYRGKVKAQKNPLYLGLYIVLFPQLIAGPIVRYETVDKQIITRNETIDLFADGVCRFMIGLGKKVIISNNLAIIADYVFESNYAENAVLTFWLGGFAYAMQIYFDFSGYSDMAIGLGKMFGFRFEENFNYPYIAYSVTDFWRRWHISLSSWFRDYVYIPLGGNKCSKGRHIINLFFVWLLTGMWHGANWTFIVWGLAYFVILVVEKYFIRPEQFESKVTRLVYRGGTLLFVLFMWIDFRANNLSQAISYCTSMFGVNTIAFCDTTTKVLLREYGIFFVISILASMPFAKRLTILQKDTWCVTIAKTIWCVVLLLISLIYIINESYNPFIYFNF